LRKGIVHGLAGPESASDKDRGGEKDHKEKEKAESPEKDAAASCDEIAPRGVLDYVWGAAGRQCRFGWGWIV
jgi:hypothetical protein